MICKESDSSYQEHLGGLRSFIKRYSQLQIDTAINVSSPD